MGGKITKSESKVTVIKSSFKGTPKRQATLKKQNTLNSTPSKHFRYFRRKVQLQGPRTEKETENF